MLERKHITFENQIAFSFLQLFHVFLYNNYSANEKVLDVRVKVGTQKGIL